MLNLIIKPFRAGLASRSAIQGQKGVLTETLKVIKNDDSIKREYHEVSGDVICPSQVMGIDHLRDPRLNKVGKCMYVVSLFLFVY